MLVSLMSASVLFAQTCLIADFPFDGNANDVSGNVNHGTVIGATPTINRYGTANSAYFFDGINDEIVINNTTLGNFGKGNYSISFWFKTSQSGSPRLIEKRTSCGQYPWNFVAINALDGSLGWSLGNANPQLYALSHGAKIVTDGQWHHVLMVRSDSLHATFLDGYLDAAVNAPALFDCDDNSSLNFGNSLCVGTLGAVRFNGSLDDVKFFDCALGAEDIYTLFSDSIICTVHDTINVFDTTAVTVFDTISITISDTITVTDTIAVTDTLFIDIALSVSPLNKIKIKVYPNPTNDLLIVDNANYFQMNNYTLRINNEAGQLRFISPFNAANITIDLNQLGATGVYLLQIFGPTNSIVEQKRIILQ